MQVVNQVQFESNRKSAKAVLYIFEDGSYHVKEVSNCNVGPVPVPVLAPSPILQEIDGE